MSNKELIAEARELIAHCATYNFGMYSADKLAHEVAGKLADALEGEQAHGNITAHIVIVHASPYEGSAVTLCCGRTPFELDRFDQMTPWLANVTCGRLKGEQA